MARITVEDCLQRVPNKYELIILASKRARQLFAGAKPLLETDNREIVTALREIAAGKVRRYAQAMLDRPRESRRTAERSWRRIFGGFACSAVGRRKRLQLARGFTEPTWDQ
jgi:DNA-directed RNA polymerase subunit omega